MTRQKSVWAVELGGRLRSARQAVGLTVIAVCAETGMSKAAIYCIEAGQRVPSLPTLMALCAAYQIQPGDVLNDL